MRAPLLLTLLVYSSVSMTTSAATDLTTAVHQASSHQPDQTHNKATKVVILGSGHPAPDPDRQGPALAILVNGSAYLVDAGSGIVRQATAAAKNGYPELKPPNLGRVFLTHLHSDHTLGLPDLLLSSWVFGRSSPFELHGPKGSAVMIENIHNAWMEDITIRTTGFQKANQTGHLTNVHEFSAGPIFEDDNIKVTAIAVPHGDWKQAFGFRFETADRVIVVSGDTSPSQAIVDACNPCDLLIHEVYTREVGAQPDGTRVAGMNWQRYFSSFHTSTEELGKLAAQANPGLLLLTHHMQLGLTSDEQMVEQIREHYDGPIEIGVDLGVY